MSKFALSLSVLGGAIKGALIAVLMAFIGLSIIGFLFGYGGPLLAVYFGGYLILYVAPIGLILGSVARIFRIARKSAKSQDGKPI